MTPITPIGIVIFWITRPLGRLVELIILLVGSLSFITSLIDCMMLSILSLFKIDRSIIFAFIFLILAFLISSSLALRIAFLFFFISPI